MEPPENRRKGRARMLTLRVSDAEHEAWKRAAGNQGVSEWLRNLANHAAAEEPLDLLTGSGEPAVVRKPELSERDQGAGHSAQAGQTVQAPRSESSGKRSYTPDPKGKK